MSPLEIEMEMNTLKIFFEFYCKHKHENQNLIQKTFLYKKEELTLEFNLCKECREQIDYSIERLRECPHEEKPRCRSCPTPCYGKKEWKETAKIMRYSGVNLELVSLNKKIKSIFK